MLFSNFVCTIVARASVSFLNFLLRTNRPVNNNTYILSYISRSSLKREALVDIEPFVLSSINTYKDDVIIKKFN